MTATKSLRLVACSFLLLTLHFVNCYAQADPAPKRFLIWDERGKFGYMDETGRVVIAPQFDRAYPFAEAVAAVSVENKSGFIDAAGKQVIPFQYFTTSSFSDGVAAVSFSEGAGQQRRSSCGYIDHANNFVIKPQNKFSCTEPFHEGFAAIEIYDERVGESLASYLNKEGQEAVAGRLSVGKPFSEGLALVEDFAKWSFVNKDGQTVIDLRPQDRSNVLADEYEPASSFSEGLAMVGITVSGSAGYSRYAFMNRRGRMVFKLRDNVIDEGDFHSGRAQVYVAMDRIVRVRVEGETFRNEAKYYSCIDRNGHIVIHRCGDPLTSAEIAEDFQGFGRAFGRGFIDGLFFSKTNVRVAGELKTVYGYMNRAGKYVWIQPHGTKITPGRR